MIDKKMNEILASSKTIIKECSNLDALQTIKVELLGKKSYLSNIAKTLPELEHSERIKMGKLINLFRQEIIALLDEQFQILKAKKLDAALLEERVDVTLPATNFLAANYHPLNLVLQEIKIIFQELGYETVSGTEVETDEYNFERLNLAKDHPARAMQDSFYIDNEYLLRTHSTNVTARYLAKYADFSKPLAVVSMGNVYRRDDDDATHSHQFMQVDGFLVAPNINFANLKWTLDYLVTRLFDKESKIRLRPSYFPFTEPSVEVDVSCTKCQGQGCQICKHTGWIEILGAGMISPEVFAKNSLPLTLQGFAFGVGIERIAMLKYDIDDIRLFYNNDYRFLKQFNNF